jgi:peptide/nickel transport system permease protein
MNWAISRILVSVLLIWVVATIVFVSIRLVPGDPAELLLSQGNSAPPPELVAALRESLGLNKPLLTQYAGNLVALLRGDLGTSMLDGASVAGEIAQRLPRTLELIAAATLIGIALALPTGTFAGLRRGGRFDMVMSWICAVKIAIPVFVLGTGLVYVFAQVLRWLPAGGYVPLTASFSGHFVNLLLPALTIGLGLFTTLFRITRRSVIETAGRDFVRTARGKGVRPHRIVLRHILRNALIPVLTVLGLNVGNLLGGTVLVESVFAYPGISSTLVDAVNGRDYPMVQGIVLVICVLFVLINLTVDLLYGVLDPRIRSAR